MNIDKSNWNDLKISIDNAIKRREAIVDKAEELRRDIDQLDEHLLELRDVLADIKSTLNYQAKLNGELS